MHLEIMFNPRFYTLPVDVDYPYILVNIFNYKKLKQFNFKHAILDSGVNRIFYKWRMREYPKHILKGIVYTAKQLSQIYDGRIWVTIPDYPDDYYPSLIDGNVEKTLRNIEEFICIDGVEWLPVIQSRNLDVLSFHESCGKAREILKGYPRIAIGTVCKTRRLDFITYCCITARKYFPNSWIHAFGLTLNALPRVKDVIDSWDSLAWTYPRRSGEASCRNKRERIEYFNNYIKRILSLTK